MSPLQLKSHQVGKILQTDYDFIFSLDGEFSVCLTAGQMQWILATSEYAAWQTRWGSSLGTEIDKNIIDAFAADLVRRIMDAIDPCGESNMFRLRQHPTNYCQLEQSLDGGLTWSLAFDYALCFQEQAENPPLTRYDDEYRELQTSYDGGVNWVNTPDNRVKSPITSNLYKDATDPACETSAQVVEYMKEFLDVDDEQLFLAIVTLLVDLVAIVLTGGAAIPLVVTLVQAFIQLGIEAFQTAMTQAEWDKFQENLYCHASSDGSWTLPAYFEIVDQLAEDHVSNAHFFLYQTLTSIGFVGLNNAGHLSYATTPNCASFDCGEEWCYEFNFLANDGAFGATFGTWVVGQGWVGTTGGTGKSIWLTKDVEPTTFTHMEVDVVFTNAGNLNFIIGGTIVIGQNGVASGTYSWDGTITDDNLILNPSAGAAQGTSVRLTRMLLRGTGTNPFGLDNCGE